MMGNLGQANSDGQI
jgi:Ca2+-binding EF-hand superfamily protein